MKFIVPTFLLMVFQMHVLATPAPHDELPVGLEDADTRAQASISKRNYNPPGLRCCTGCPIC
ncbi:hypothetical protein PGT21_006653 [Puccinia graminis f. sp. tritici]|uniref:Uncharacterized protein n=1 Tax=Puccinia graminis f. sp. tritici TaxID=56615 RepID=A0A5B0Q5D7_PUCGR|nr:hypothetical protein PGT21_006653 [Puccinia graminis f. sp. tritici]KAA1138765.1 hypothetical protein PGTUg99_035949 [Puccinia graminis f. sp. tritici]